MGILNRRRRDRPMSETELDERSQVDGIKYRDLQVVGQLTQVGADLKAARPTVFCLYFPAQATGTAAADALRAEGFAVTIGPLPEDYLAEHPDAPNPWRVTAERADKALVPDFLRETVDGCAEIADEFGGEYAGWECGFNDAEVALLKARQQ